MCRPAPEVGSVFAQADGLMPSHFIASSLCVYIYKLMLYPALYQWIKLVGSLIVRRVYAIVLSTFNQACIFFSRLVFVVVSSPVILARVICLSFVLLFFAASARHSYGSSKSLSSFCWLPVIGVSACYVVLLFVATTLFQLILFSRGN